MHTLSIDLRYQAIYAYFIYGSTLTDLSMYTLSMNLRYRAIYAYFIYGSMLSELSMHTLSMHTLSMDLRYLVYLCILYLWVYAI